MGACVLLLDADAPRCSRLQRGFERHGFCTISVSSVSAALNALGEREVAAVVATLAEDAGVVEACHRISREMPQVAVVVVANEATVSQAVEALRAGASDYVTESTDTEAIREVVERVLEARALRVQVEALRSRAPDANDPIAGKLIGSSPAIEDLRGKFLRIASSEGTVLLTGESGTGKGLMARLLHAASRRQQGPFVAIDCAALPEQLVESELFGHAKGAFTGAAGARTGLLVRANGGTILLDEITSMPLGTQAKLLRALQERAVRPLGDSKEVPFDARVIAATNANLETSVAAGQFRGDLFFRLNVLALHLPALRERGKDVLLLAQHFVERFSASGQKRIVGLTPGAARVLVSHGWPGNVRELANWIEAAVLNARYDHITELDLPNDGRSAAPVGPAPGSSSVAPLESVEMEHIHEVLRSVDGNKSRAAKILGLDRKTLARKLKLHENAD
jgi:two-component system, NtrC family, response regulator AtoC